MEAIGGPWREAIEVAVETTKAVFPGGEVMTHLDHKLVIPKELISILTLKTLSKFTFMLSLIFEIL